MQGFIDVIKFIIGLIFLIAIGVIIVLCLFILGILGFNKLSYNLNNSMCDVMVENKMVYSGRCHYISIYPVSEMDGSKHLKIYKDILKLHPDKQYINSNITVTPKEINDGNNL